MRYFRGGLPRIFRGSSAMQVKLILFIDERNSCVNVCYFSYSGIFFNAHMQIQSISNYDSELIIRVLSNPLQIYGRDLLEATVRINIEVHLVLSLCLGATKTSFLPKT